MTPASQAASGSPAVSEGLRVTPALPFLPTPHHRINPLCVFAPFARGATVSPLNPPLRWCGGRGLGDQRADVAGGRLVPDNNEPDPHIAPGCRVEEGQIARRAGAEGGEAREAEVKMRGRESRGRGAGCGLQAAWGEHSSPAFCSADPISNIPIPVICRVLNSLPAKRSRPV